MATFDEVQRVMKGIQRGSPDSKFHTVKEHHEHSNDSISERLVREGNVFRNTILIPGAR